MFASTPPAYKLDMLHLKNLFGWEVTLQATIGPKIAILVIRAIR